MTILAFFIIVFRHGLHICPEGGERGIQRHLRPDRDCPDGTVCRALQLPDLQEGYLTHALDMDSLLRGGWAELGDLPAL